MSTSRNQETNRIVIPIVVIGFLVVFFSFGKSVIDLLNAPSLTIDIAEDDEIQAGFLPVYIEEDVQADAGSVAVNVGELPGGSNDGQLESSPLPGSAFPTPIPDELPPIEQADPGMIPESIRIASIDLEANIVPVEFAQYEYEGSSYQQWLAPEGRNVGWHNTSAGLGVAGNTVLNGHHNIKGMVFRDLYQVQVGDTIEVSASGQVFTYVVVHTDILAERNQPIEVRLSNAEWIKETDDERLTIITCWPFESNTHRVVVVAVPVRSELAAVENSL